MTHRAPPERIVVDTSQRMRAGSFSYFPFDTTGTEYVRADLLPKWVTVKIPPILENEDVAIRLIVFGDGDFKTIMFRGSFEPYVTHWLSNVPPVPEKQP